MRAATGTSKGIRSYRERHELPKLHFFKNMEGPGFFAVAARLPGAGGATPVPVSGECAYLGVPVVNIGSRQAGRQRGPNVTDVSYDTDAILRAMQGQWAHGRVPGHRGLRGRRDAGAKIANELARMPLTFSKKITY